MRADDIKPEVMRESIALAIRSIEFCISDLRDSTQNASWVESLVVIDAINDAAKLRLRLVQLSDALRPDSERTKH